DTGPCYSEHTSRVIRETAGYTLAPGIPSGVQDCIVELRRTYRFTEESGIRRLGEAIRSGDIRDCMEMIRHETFSDVTVREMERPESLRQALRPVVLEGYAPFLRAADIGERFTRLRGFRVLCALREGPYGVNAVNGLIETVLAEEGLIRTGRQHYHGRPVLITSNDYALRLFNGDIGIILEDEEDGELKCFFPGAGSSVRKISCLRLPEHETAFAMTVHKSQGSEFSKVVLLLPPQDSPVLCRELIYTGMTRAMKHLELWMKPEVFLQSAARRTERISGLAGLLGSRGGSGDAVFTDQDADIPQDSVI
ncbi:MAG TPA: ATP-binding domain-containing protein, partial [Deltaproteobacteria bacterium]|nr:ATP-binding domain-containing protein [Deltaproteobacteria bacterium]